MKYSKINLPSIQVYPIEIEYNFDFIDIKEIHTATSKAEIYAMRIAIR